VFGFLEIRTLWVLFIGVEFELIVTFFLYLRDLLLFCIFELIYFLLVVKGIFNLMILVLGMIWHGGRVRFCLE
jgi:hypothetical protein